MRPRAATAPPLPLVLASLSSYTARCAASSLVGVSAVAAYGPPSTAAAAIATDARRRAFGIIIGKISWKLVPAAVLEHKEVAPPPQLPMRTQLEYVHPIGQNSLTSIAETGGPIGNPQRKAAWPRL